MRQHSHPLGPGLCVCREWANASHLTAAGEQAVGHGRHGRHRLKVRRVARGGGTRARPGAPARRRRLRDPLVPQRLVWRHARVRVPAQAALQKRHERRVIAPQLPRAKHRAKSRPATRCELREMSQLRESTASSCRLRRPRSEHALSPAGKMSAFGYRRACALRLSPCPVRCGCAPLRRRWGERRLAPWQWRRAPAKGEGWEGMGGSIPWRRCLWRQGFASCHGCWPRCVAHWRSRRTACGASTAPAPTSVARQSPVGVSVPPTRPTVRYQLVCKDIRPPSSEIEIRLASASDPCLPGLSQKEAGRWSESDLDAC